MERLSSKSTDEMYFAVWMRFEKSECPDAKVALEDTISELMREGRTRDQAILFLYENPAYGLTKNRGIYVIVVLNIVLYV